MRKAHCLGCDHTFPQMHQLFAHRRTDRCGGRFMPQDERDSYNLYLFYKGEAGRIRWFDPDGATICLAKATEFYDDFIYLRYERLDRDGYPDYTRFSMTGLQRKPKRKPKPKHKARVPGRVRISRMPLGNGFRGFKSLEESTIDKFFSQRGVKVPKL